MSDFRKLRYRLRNKYVNQGNRERLVNTDFSIISSDCTGGVMCHDLKQQFRSPTVNFFFPAADYIKFIYGIDAYLNIPMVDITSSDDKWPVAKMNDITLQLVHYRSVEEAQIAWDRRKDRINKENSFFIFNDRNGFTEDDLDDFQKLPYKNKVCFVSDKRLAEKYDCAFYIDKSEKNSDEVYTMTAFVPKVGIHRLVDEFDYVGWINGKSVKDIISDKRGQGYC